MFMLPIYIYYLSQYIQNHWAEKFLDFVIHTVQFDEKALNDLLLEIMGYCLSAYIQSFGHYPLLFSLVFLQILLVKVI